MFVLDTNILIYIAEKVRVLVLILTRLYWPQVCEKNIK